MSRSVALLLTLFLVGCGGATRGFRSGPRQHTLRYSGQQGNTPAQSVSGESLGQGLPRAVFQFLPRGATTAAEVGPATATGEALVVGGAVVAAGGSVVLVCLTIKAALNGTQTPIDIADTFYGTHFGDLQGWVQGCYAPKATVSTQAPAPTQEVKPVPGIMHLPLQGDTEKPMKPGMRRTGDAFMRPTRNSISEPAATTQGAPAW